MWAKKDGVKAGSIDGVTMSSFMRVLVARVGAKRVAETMALLYPIALPHVQALVLNFCS